MGKNGRLKTYFTVGPIRRGSTAVFQDVKGPGGEKVRVMNERVMDKASGNADDRLREILRAREKEPAA